MTVRQLIVHRRHLRSVRADQRCCGGLCTTSVEARTAPLLCPCGCGYPPSRHNPNATGELRSAA